MPVLIDNYDSEIKDFSGDELSLFAADNFNQHKNDTLYQTAIYNYLHQRNKYEGNEIHQPRLTDNSQYTSEEAKQKANSKIQQQPTSSPLNDLSEKDRKEVEEDLKKNNLTVDDLGLADENSNLLETQAKLPTLSNVIDPLVNQEFSKIKEKVGDEVKHSAGYQFVRSEGEQFKNVLDTAFDAGETQVANDIKGVSKAASNAILDLGNILYPHETKKFNEVELPLIHQQEEKEAKDNIKRGIIDKINKARKTEGKRELVKERIDERQKEAMNVAHAKSVKKQKDAQEYSLNPFSENFYLWH